MREGNSSPILYDVISSIFWCNVKQGEGDKMREGNYSPILYDLIS